MLFRQFLDPVSHTYTYLLADASAAKAVLIDPVLDKTEVYQQVLSELGLHLLAAIDTHTHADHVTALGRLRELTGCETIMGALTGADCVSRRVSEGDVIAFGRLSLQVLDTPGHTAESISLLFDGPTMRAVFTGDVLLIRGSGRTDFQAGDAGASWDSVTGKLFSLPGDTIVYPAHDYKGWSSSTIAEERSHNPRFAGQTRDSYISIMANLKLPRPELMDVAVPANLACGVSPVVGQEPGSGPVPGRDAAVGAAGPGPGGNTAYASVPATGSFPYRVGFMGAGRLARAVSRALQAAGVPIAAVASRSKGSADKMAAALHACRSMQMQELADTCDLVFITTPDAAISAAAQSLRWRAGQWVVHCSGATPVAALDAAAAAGALTGGFHPMQAFGDDVHAAMHSLPGCTVAIEAPAPLDDVLYDLATRLGCKGLHLPPGARARYHASGGFASQHLHVLMAQGIRLWQSWGASEQEALNVLLPLMRGTIESLEQAGIVGGMAGPLTRGDTCTVRLHRQALHELDPGLRELYDSLCTLGVDMLRQGGRLDPSVADALDAVLREDCS